MIIAGEVSGDLHGAEVVRAILRETPETVFSGMGGAAMASAGVDILVDAASLSVMGITEVLTRIGPILDGFRIIRRALRAIQPDLLILIDFPDFNLRVARIAKLLGIRVLYYISPQIWAWRTGRVKTIRKRVDHMAVIFPFETRFFTGNDVDVTYVGHPLLDHQWPMVNAPGNDPFPVIGLLPGSRPQEISRHLPLMLESALAIRRHSGPARFLIGPVDAAQQALAAAMVKAHHATGICDIIDGGARAVFSRCHLVIAASGTVTLEAAISGVPMVVIYKVSPLSYLLGRVMIRVKFISLVNLVAGREVVPELIQKEASPGRITGKVLEILSQPGRLDTIRRDLADVREILGTGGAARRVAKIALEMMV
ncbi:MAG: lipid-A-disaccharide synthase [Deltaproteobacteria bacterium]|nr:MAG: lipid-A-disaccharide synthase [Deltaproteobacteria bacterium]